MKVTFTNKTNYEGKIYEQGKTYNLVRADVRHLLTLGKVKVEAPQKRATKPVSDNKQTVDAPKEDTATKNNEE